MDKKLSKKHNWIYFNWELPTYLYQHMVIFSLSQQIDHDQDHHQEHDQDKDLDHDLDWDNIFHLKFSWLT